MISILEHVEVIFLGWLQPKKSYASDTFILPYSKIVWKLLKSVLYVKLFIQKHALILLHCILSLLLTLLQNGALILYIVSLPQPGGMSTSLFLLTTLLNELRLCLHMLTMIRLPQCSFLITLFLGMEFLEPSLLIMVIILITI